MSPWLWPDCVFYLLPQGRRLNRCVQVLHSFTQRVIDQRLRWVGDIRYSDIVWVDTTKVLLIRIYRKEKLSALNVEMSRETKKLALLDLLIEAHLKDGSVSISDIIEENNIAFVKA